MRSLLIKGLTLVGFFSLIILFLLYRTDKLDSYLPGNNSDLQTSHNGGAINSTDSINKRDSVERLRMYSSKAAILPKPEISKTPNQQKVIMSSSKSIVILKNNRAPRQINQDSLYLDSIIKMIRKL